MSKTELLKILGQPLARFKTQEGFDHYDFFFALPRSSKAQTIRLSGVTVYLRDDRVTHWTPIYQRSGKQQSIPVSPKGKTDANETRQNRGIEMWVVNGTIGFDVRSLDLNKLREKQIIPEKPALVINRLKSAEASAQELVLMFADQDRERFGILTRTNIGRQILVTMNSRPVITPIVPGEILNGMLQIPINSPSEREQLEKEIHQFYLK